MLTLKTIELGSLVESVNQSDCGYVIMGTKRQGASNEVIANLFRTRRVSSRQCAPHPRAITCRLGL